MAYTTCTAFHRVHGSSHNSSQRHDYACTAVHRVEAAVHTTTAAAVETLSNSSTAKQVTDKRVLGTII